LLPYFAAFRFLAARLKNRLKKLARKFVKKQLMLCLHLTENKPATTGFSRRYVHPENKTFNAPILPKAALQI
jgi:hypothetical protein